MRPFIAILAITVALICLAMAQTFDFVPTKLCTDNSNAPASTAYVHACAGGGGGGVTSWNGRIGVVTPQTGDYSFSNISGVATGAQLPFPSASTLGGTESGTAPANQFMTGITTLGVPTFAQPSFSNISGVASNAQIPVPTPSALGGVESITCGGGQFINVISASGVPSCASGGGGGTPGGSNGQVQYNNSGAFGGLTNTQLTADINVFTSTLSGAVPASGGSSTSLFLAQNGTFQTPAGGGNVSTSGTITTGNCAQWASATTIQSTSAPCSSGGAGAFGDYVNIKSFGAIGDGTCHVLSGIYGSLAAAQAVYPFVSDLSQCVDWAAIQQAINVAYNTAPLANGAFPVYCPTGTYVTSNPIIFDQPNNTAGTNPAWAAGTTYGNGAQVTYNGIPWQSAGSGNVGNGPTAFSANFPSNLQPVINGNYPAGFPWAVVSISNANPAVITPLQSGGSSLNVFANEPMVFFTQQFTAPGGATPALPTGINANQVYYVVGSSITSTTFQISTTPGGAAIATSSAGVGTFTMSFQVWQVAVNSSAAGFSSQVSWIGDQNMIGNSGCQIIADQDWLAPAFIVGPQNGVQIKNLNIQGPVPGAGTGSPGTGGYRCTAPASLGGPAQTANGNALSVGIAIMSSGGGATRTKYENAGAEGFYIDTYLGWGNSGQLADHNTFINPYFQGGCINIYTGETQVFINSIYDGKIGMATNQIFASQQEGFIIKGGDYSTFDGLASAFTISGVSTSATCGNMFLCVTGTLSASDVNFDLPMCAYSAGQASSIGAEWLNAWPFAAGCGYNTFLFKTAQWGIVGAYMMNYVPTTKQFTVGIPKAFSAIYQGACCGSNLATQLAAATTMYAVEAPIIFFGNNQVEGIHVENDGVPYTLSCFCTQFFGGVKPAELKNVFMNAEASLGATTCCNQAINNKFAYRFLAQQAIPYINSSLGDTIVDYLNGGGNTFIQGPPALNARDMDRLLLATGNGNYIEVRHSVGTSINNGQSTGSAWNAQSPLFDFYPRESFAIPLVGATQGQLSGSYLAYGGQALGSGTWDNGSSLVPFSALSLNASGQPSDMANIWRSKGWGQAPQWGVRPAPWTNPCILPSQATSLAAPPAITFIANFQDIPVITSGGTGYTVGNTLTFVGGTGTAATVQVDAVSGGVITAVHVTATGAYTAIPTSFTVTGGSGSGATFAGSTAANWFMNYIIGYPMLWGGHVYHACNFNDASFAGPKYAIKSTHQAYSYFQNLTTTNVGTTLASAKLWSMDGASPFINMPIGALELMFPGLQFNLVSDGTGGCTAIAAQNFMVLEVHPTLGYVKVVRADTDGAGFVPSLAASGITCTGTTIGQASPSLVNPY